LQLYFRRDDLGQEKYDILKLYDMGDFINVSANSFSQEPAKKPCTSPISLYFPNRSFRFLKNFTA
jgi:lysyl-tRNA synthetase class II